MTTPLFCCFHCPTDAGAFYSHGLSGFVAHLQTQHGLLLACPTLDVPLEALAEEARCRSCGEPIDPKAYDGYCGPCFMAKFLA